MLRFAAFTTLVLISGAACSSADDDDSPADTAGSGGGTASGGASAASSGGSAAPAAGGSGGTGGGAVGVAGTGGGTAATGGAAAGGAGGRSASACQDKEARFHVDDGEELLLETGAWYSSTVGVTEPGAWQFTMRLTRGSAPNADYSPFAMFGGVGKTAMGLGGPREVFADGTSMDIARSLWALDATTTALGDLLCTSETSGSTLVRSGEHMSFDLDQATVLGTCPGGEAVAGELKACMDFDCPREEDLVTGSLEGVDWTTKNIGYQSGVPYTLSFNDGSMLFFLDAGTSLGAWGVLLTTPESPSKGAVYCIGSASLSDDLMYWTFGSFTRLGTCTGGGSKTIAGCAHAETFL